MKKHLKVLGLTAVAAFALMALVGASSASASGKICSTAGTGEACGGSHGKLYTGQIHAVLGNTTGTAEKHVVLTSGFIQVTCTESTLQGEVTAPGVGTGFITALTFGGCTASSGGACTANSSASAANKWHFTAVKSGKGDGNGTLVVKTVTGTFTCTVFGSPVTCRYSSAEAGGKGEIDLFGSDTTPIAEATGVPLAKEEVSSGFCSATATWEGVYHVTTPTSLFVT
jgi:hypothetical protein